MYFQILSAERAMIIKPIKSKDRKAIIPPIRANVIVCDL